MEGKINEAKQRIDSLELRKSTVLRLAEYIVKNQEDFFIFGEIGLSPMLMKDAAAELGWRKVPSRALPIRNICLARAVCLHVTLFLHTGS